MICRAAKHRGASQQKINRPQLTTRNRRVRPYTKWPQITLSPTTYDKLHSMCKGSQRGSGLAHGRDSSVRTQFRLFSISNQSHYTIVVYPRQVVDWSTRQEITSDNPEARHPASPSWAGHIEVIRSATPAGCARRVKKPTTEHAEAMLVDRTIIVRQRTAIILQIVGNENKAALNCRCLLLFE